MTNSNKQNFGILRLVKVQLVKIVATFILMSASFICYSTDAIRLKIAGNIYSDETVIRFIDGADNGFDTGYDASKLFSPNRQVPDIYTMVDSTNDLCVNTYAPLISECINTDVYIRNYTKGVYTFTCELFGVISPNVGIYMEDIESGNNYDLRTGASYTFLLEIDSLSLAPRFIIHFIVPTIPTSKSGHDKVSHKKVHVQPLGITNELASTYDIKKTKVYNSSEGLVILLNGDLPGVVYTISVYNTTGQLLYESSKTTIDQSFLLPHFDPINHILIVKLNDGKNLFSEKILINE